MSLSEAISDWGDDKEGHICSSANCWRTNFISHRDNAPEAVSTLAAIAAVVEGILDSESQMTAFDLAEVIKQTIIGGMHVKPTN